MQVLRTCGRCRATKPAKLFAGTKLCRECANRPVSVQKRILAYLSDHPHPTAAEVAAAVGANPRYVRQVARRKSLPLAAECDFPLGRTRPLVTPEELFRARKDRERHVLSTHEEILLYFREFARARGIPWRVAMTQSVEFWMELNRRRPVTGGVDREMLFAGVLLP